MTSTSIPALNLPRPLGSERRYILRAMLQNRNWAGKSVGLLTVDELAEGLASVGVTQDELNDALVNVPGPAAPTVAAPSQPVVRDQRRDPVSNEAETLRRRIGALVFDGNITGADAVVNDLLRRVLAAEAEAKALKAQAVVTPMVEPEPLPTVTGFKTAGELFGMPRAKFAGWKVATYTPTSETPAVDARFRWDPKATHMALACFRAAAHGDNPGDVLLIGPPGTGKSTWCEQFAAVTGRPFYNVSFSDSVEPNDLIGTIDPTYTDGLRWKDGVFTRAIRTPGAAILLDEIGAAKPSAAIAFNAILQRRVLVIAETGEVVPFAPGVLIMATSNDLLGRTSAGMQHFGGLHRQNAAFGDRFAVQVWLGHPSKAVETAMLQDRVRDLPKTLARLLVETAHMSRVKLGEDEVSYGIGFRRLMSWGRLLVAGVPAQDAWTSAVLHFLPEGDHEVYRELAKTQGVLDEAVIDAARNNLTVNPVDPNQPGGEFQVVADPDADADKDQDDADTV